MWKEVIIATIEMNAGASGCKEGEARRKFGNNSPLVA